MNELDMHSAPVETHEEWALRKNREAMMVSRFQAKAALHQAGLLEQAESFVSNSDDMLVKLAWQEAQFHRTSQMVANIGHAMGMTDAQIDDLFKTAGQIQA